MKLISIVVFFVIAVLVNAETRHYDLRDSPHLFLDFVKKFDRQYKDTSDVVEHYAAFVLNLVEINKLNERKTSAEFGINQFTDFTKAEFHDYNHLGPEKPISRNRNKPPVPWN